MEVCYVGQNRGIRPAHRRRSHTVYPLHHRSFYHGAQGAEKEQTKNTAATCGSHGKHQKGCLIKLHTQPHCNKSAALGICLLTVVIDKLTLTVSSVCLTSRMQMRVDCLINIAA